MSRDAIFEQLLITGRCLLPVKTFATENEVGMYLARVEQACLLHKIDYELIESKDKLSVELKANRYSVLIYDKSLGIFTDGILGGCVITNALSLNLFNYV